MRGQDRKRGIAHGHAEAVGFREDGFFVDQLLDDPLRDAELPQHALVELVAVCGPQGLDLRLVGALVRSHQDFTSVDGRQDVGRGGAGAAGSQKAWHVEQDKRRHDNPQAPLEPVPVLAHPVEHRHVGSVSFT
jgi:hypothetical protein